MPKFIVKKQSEQKKKNTSMFHALDGSFVSFLNRYGISNHVAGLFTRPPMKRM